MLRYWRLREHGCGRGAYTGATGARHAPENAPHHAPKKRCPAVPPRAAVGLVLASSAIVAIQRWWISAVPGLQSVTVDGWVIRYTLALSVVTGIVCGGLERDRQQRFDHRHGDLYRDCPRPGGRVSETQRGDHAQRGIESSLTDESRDEGAAAGRRLFGLTRLSHELSATPPDPSASAAFYGAFLAPDQARAPRRTVTAHLGAAVRSTPPVPSGRAPCSDGASDSSRRKPVRKAG